MSVQENVIAKLAPNMEFARLASAQQIETVVKALQANRIQALVVKNGEQARDEVLRLIPAGAEVYVNVSKTLETIGITAEIDQSGRYDAVRPKVLSLDRKTQADEIRKLRSRPAYMIGSVHAITETGQIMTASNTGSQLAAYAYGAGRVILAVGTQKIVKNLGEGFRRIKEYSYPLEDARLRATMGAASAVSKTLIIDREPIPNRMIVILVRENLGF